MRNARTELRKCLAHLYPREETQRRIVRDAGLADEEIAFAATAIDTWDAIIAKAIAKGRIDQLIDAVGMDDQDVTELRSLVKAYAASIEPATGRGAPSAESAGAGVVVLPASRSPITIATEDASAPDAAVPATLPATESSPSVRSALVGPATTKPHLEHVIAGARVVSASPKPPVADSPKETQESAQGHNAGIAADRPARRSVLAGLGVAGIVAVGAAVRCAIRRRSTRIALGFSMSNANGAHAYLENVKQDLLPRWPELSGVELSYHILTNAEGRAAALSGGEGYDLLTVDEPWIADVVDTLEDIEALSGRRLPNVHLDGLRDICVSNRTRRLIGAPFRTNVLAQMFRMDRLANAGRGASVVQVDPSDCGGLERITASVNGAFPDGVVAYSNEISNTPAEVFLWLYRACGAAVEDYSEGGPIRLKRAIAERCRQIMNGWGRRRVASGEVVSDMLAPRLDGPLLGYAWASWLALLSSGTADLESLLKSRAANGRTSLELRFGAVPMRGAWILSVPREAVRSRALEASLAAKLAMRLSSETDAQAYLWAIGALPAASALWAGNDPRMPMWVKATYESPGESLGDAARRARGRLSTRDASKKQDALNDYIVGRQYSVEYLVVE